MSRSSDRFTTAMVVGAVGTLLAGGAGGVVASAAAPASPPPASGPMWQWPLHGDLKIGDRFGDARPHGKHHQGVDLKAATGTPVYASQGGKVTRSDGTWDPSGYGNLIVLDHDGGWQTYYAHLSQFEVHVGDAVTQGQEIGRVGETGDAKGPHLHFETRQGGKEQDPQKVITSTPAAAPAASGGIDPSCRPQPGKDLDREVARRCWSPLLAKYGTWNRDTAFNVLWCESKGNSDARNPTPVGGKHATGLMQVLDGPTDPEANVKQAADMYAARGWRPWECKG